jgi:hypothetical protein
MAFTLLCLMAGCGRHGGEPAGSPGAGNAATPASGLPGVPAQSAGKPPGATLAVAGTLFDGDDVDQIRAYLKTVKEIVPARRPAAG